jgi:hypothetical protein
MIIALVFVAVVLAFVFRKRIQQWLETFEGPIARLRNNRNEEEDLQAQNGYNYSSMQMAPQNINYNDPNSAYQYAPPQNSPIYPANYQQSSQFIRPAYYMPPQPPQANPYETNQAQLNDNEVQARYNNSMIKGSGVNPYIK